MEQKRTDWNVCHTFYQKTMSAAEHELFRTTSGSWILVRGTENHTTMIIGPDTLILANISLTTLLY